MKTLKSPHTNSFKSYLLIASLFCSFLAIGQNTPEDNFKLTVDEMVDSQSKVYHKLDSAFQNTKNDTLKMRYLYNKAYMAEYPEGQSFALNMLGVSYRNYSLYNKAISLHLEAQDLAHKNQNIDLEVISFNMLGVVYRRLDLIRAALDYHKQALDLAETVTHPSNDLKQSIAVSQNSMGNIYLALKQYDLALNLFKKSLVIERQMNNKLGLAINHQNIGYAQEEKGYLDQALTNYKISLNYNNEIDSEIGKVICYNSIGKVYIKQNRLDEAQKLITNALEKALASGDQFYIATSYNNLGWTQLKLNELEAAEESLTKSLEIAQQYNLKSSEIEAFSHLSELYEAMGKYQEAFVSYKKSENLDRIITNERNVQYVNDLILKYESEKKNNQIKALASENEIVKLKLEQSKKMYFVGLGSLVLLISILYILHRQRKLRDEKKIITLEQDMLRNQMNPHFIFNSLNSIKLYIINNEKENAVYYLNKFSKLIRKILVASTEKEITLEDELETMSLYMNIENIRFSNEIDYKVMVDKRIDPSMIKVPSLVLQPFLENAVWHGLSAKTGEKKIVLEIEKNANGYVTIKITDNGVGREASKTIKSQKTLSRKSVGISLTKERLANFSKNYASSYHLNILDLKDDSNNPLGTCVVIDIPVEQVKLRTA